MFHIESLRTNKTKKNEITITSVKLSQILLAIIVPWSMSVSVRIEINKIN